MTIPTTTTTTAYDFGTDRSAQTRFRTAVSDANGAPKELRDVRSQIVSAAIQVQQCCVTATFPREMENRNMIGWE